MGKIIQGKYLKLKFRDYVIIVIAFLFSELSNGQAVDVWLTTGDQINKLTQKDDLTFSSGNDATGTIIDINKRLTYQTMDGFGAAMSGSSAYNMQTHLSSNQRDNLMNDLFTNAGVRLNFIRHTIGASDFNVKDYTYNDIPEGETDPSLDRFSLSRDTLFVIPSLKEALIKNPTLKIMGSPWTAPAWMKTEYTLFGSRLNEQWYSTYADYFVKYIQKYEAEGIPIWAVSVQNEPDFAPNYYPSMKWTADEHLNFVKNDIGPAFENAGLSTGIMVYDHNWDLVEYPITIMNDPDAKKYTIGSAFHAYGGKVSAQTTMHNAHPDKGIWFTEISGIDSQGDSSVSSFPDSFTYFLRDIIISATRNWAKGVLFWNLALDENYGPQPHTKGCRVCTGVVTISTNGTITKNVEYYALGHFSKFVDQGAIRIFSTDTNNDNDDYGGISNVAFQNPDDSIVVIVHNNSSSDTEEISIRMLNQSFNYTLPSKSAVTFKWTPDDDQESESQPTFVNVYINNEIKLSIDDITDTSSYPTAPINAMVGDELILEVGNTEVDIPEIMGLPDLWFAQAFSREGIMMSSKSITPGAFKPWVPFGTTPHTTWVTTIPKKLHKPDELQPTKYPDWEFVDGKYQFKWTLQRTMDANLQYNGLPIDYADKYPDEEAPWWQTLDESENLILDGTGKFNPDGGVPYGEHTKPDGKHPQRQGKFMGQSMQLLHAMKGTLKTAYGANTNFSDGNPYTSKTDGDDVFTNEFKDPSTTPFNVVTPSARLYRPFVELWKVVPERESNNPVNDIVTWYQKAIHEDIGKNLPRDYRYDGYEIWEDPIKNPVSKAPGKIILRFNRKILPLSFNVQSPLEDDKFYVLYKANDDDNVRDFVVGTQELEIGLDKHVKQNIVNQLRLNNSKFDLVLPFNSLNHAGSIYGSSSGALVNPNPDAEPNPNPVFGPNLPVFGPNPWPGHDDFGTIIPLTLNDNGTLSGDMIFDVEKHGKILPLTVLLLYRRTPESEPVIISGQDFWYSSWVEALKCLEYNNESESRSLTKFNFHITNFYEDQISIAEGLAHGLPITEERRMNQEFVVMKGEKLTFTLWDDVDFAFKNVDTKWYVSSRKKWQQLSEPVAAKRLRTKLYKYADNGALISETILQDFGQGNSLTIDYTFETVGNYVFEVAMRQEQSAYRVFVKVMDSQNYGNGHEGRVKVRDLLPREVNWVNSTLTDENKITGNDFQLAMMSDVKSSYAWKQPKDGGGPRSYMKNDGSGEAKYIDRFAPFNDYADHYVYELDNSGIKQSTQNIQAFQNYIETREPYFRILPGVWANHMDPLGIGNKYGVQDEFVLENRINDITSSFIQDAFTEVQQTYAGFYTVDYQNKKVNSRSPRNWEIKVPWGSYSKYHGFRLRDVPKAPVNAQKLKEAILIHMKTGLRVNNPMPQVKYGIFDTEEDKLEYMFLLNLKHKRWVVIPKSVNNVIFYHGSDQGNLIASGFRSNPTTLSGLEPAELESNKKYIVVNDKNQCLNTSVVGSQLGWYTYTDAEEKTNDDSCEKFSVNSFEDKEFARIIQSESNRKYLTINSETLSLSSVSTESEIIPYKLKDRGTQSGVYLGNNLSGRTTAITTFKCRFTESLTLLPPSEESEDNIVTSHTTASVLGTLAGGLTIGGGILAGGYFYATPLSSEEIGLISNNNEGFFGRATRGLGQAIRRVTLTTTNCFRRPHAD